MAVATWFARKTGSDSNGGSSASIRSQGTDAVTNGTTTVTAASASWSASDVGHYIWIGGLAVRRQITAVNSATSITVSGAGLASGSGRTWVVGGALLTLAVLLGAAGMSSGDTAYVGAGVYREKVTALLTSPTVETKVIADVDGSHTGDSGLVIWSAYVSGDTTTPTGTTLTLNGRDFLTFQGFIFVGAAGIIDATTTLSTNITFKSCALLPGSVQTSNVAVDVTTTFGNALHWLFDSCIFSEGGVGFRLTIPSGAGSDYDTDVIVQNCRFDGFAGAAIKPTSSGASAQKGGGVLVYNCSFLGGARAVQLSGSLLSTSIPCKVYNSLCLGQTTSCLDGGAASQLTEDYNVLLSGTPRTNVTAGTHSTSGDPFPYAPLFNPGVMGLFGFENRPYGEPLDGSPFLGFGSQSGGPAVDLLGRNRPSGGKSASYAVGAFERGNTAVRNTATTHVGANAAQLAGPGVQEHQLAVLGGAAMTVSVYVQWDATYAGTKPQLKVTNGAECGVADATAQAVGSSGAWELLSLTFTPTSDGIVTLQVVSLDTNGAGNVFYDTWGVA